MLLGRDRRNAMGNKTMWKRVEKGEREEQAVLEEEKRNERVGEREQEREEGEREERQ